MREIYRGKKLKKQESIGRGGRWGVCGPCGGRYPAFVLTVKKESEMLKVERFFFSINAGVLQMSLSERLAVLPFSWRLYL